MKQALACLCCLTLASCATTAPRFTISPPSPGWLQAGAIAPDPGPDVRQPLLRLRHQIGAEITVEEYRADAEFFGDRPIAEIAAAVQKKLLYDDARISEIRDRGSILSFDIAFLDAYGFWRGKVAVRKLPGAPPDTVFVFTGRWRPADDLLIGGDFDAVVDTAAVK